MRDEVHLLVNRADAQRFGFLGRARINGLAGKLNRSRIARDDASEHFNEGAFPGAIFSHEGVHLAGADGEVNPLQRLDARKSAGQAAYLEQGAAQYLRLGSSAAAW